MTWCTTCASGASRRAQLAPALGAHASFRVARSSRLVFGDGSEPLTSPGRHSKPRGGAARVASPAPRPARAASPPAPAQRPVARRAPPPEAARPPRAAPLLVAVALLAALLAAWFAPPLHWPVLPRREAGAAPQHAHASAELAELRRRVAALETRVAELPQHACEPPPPLPPPPPPPPVVPSAPAASVEVVGPPATSVAPSAPPANVAAEVAAALDRSWADRTGRPDYAAAAAGGRVLAHSPLVAWAAGGDASALHPRADHLLLTSALETPGHCLPLNASAGAWVDVALREAVHVTAVSLEHVHRAIAFDMRSAPRRFALAALRDGGGEGATLVSGSFDAEKGAAVQTFAAEAVGEAAGEAVSRVRLVLRSNHGAEYTCLYRLRVHGKPVTPNTRSEMADENDDDASRRTSD